MRQPQHSECKKRKNHFMPFLLGSRQLSRCLFWGTESSRPCSYIFWLKENLVEVSLHQTYLVLQVPVQFMSVSRDPNRIQSPLNLYTTTKEETTFFYKNPLFQENDNRSRRNRRAAVTCTVVKWEENIFSGVDWWYFHDSGNHDHTYSWGSDSPVSFQIGLWMHLPNMFYFSLSW